MGGATEQGQIIGNRYRLLHKLGEGGMGTVYRALDRLHQQTVALKRVSAPTEALDFTTLALTDTTVAQTALAHEFQLLASLHHPHVIGVLDYGFDTEQQPFFTMSLLESAQPITRASQDKPLEVKIRYLIEMLQALVYLHQRDIIHRDLKPDNALVTADNTVKVLDFGIAVKREQIDPTDARISGTIAYMAPEVLQGMPASEAADLYAVGVIAYEVLIGRHPFAGVDPAQLVQNILIKPPSLAGENLEPALAAVLERLLQKAPEARYQTAYEAIRVLCEAIGQPLPRETAELRESFLQAARFVGRDKELTRLSAALEDASEGRGSAWLIGGESGVGKSRLLDEIRTQAMVKGALVLHGQSAADGGLPYQLWREPLRHLVLAVELTDAEAAILKQIVPDVEVLLDRQIPDPPLLEGQAGRQRLLRTIVGLFRNYRGLTLMALEDLHWASESLPVLRELLPAVPDLRLLIISDYRDDERPGLPAELPQMQAIKLERLSGESIEALSASMLGDAGRQPQVVDLLKKETEGNAFFLVEVVRALAEEVGRLNEIGRMTLPKQVFAGGVQQVVQRRLNRVPVADQDLLKVAAIIGRQIDLDALRLLGDGRDLDAWLTVCSNAAVIELSDEHWRFAHDKLREAVLVSLSEEKRQELHKQAAASLEKAHSDHVNEYAALIADHYEQAGEQAQAVDWHLQAGRYAQEGYIPGAAVAHYQKVLAYWKEHPETRSRAGVQWTAVYNGLGGMLTWLARYAEAAETFSAMRVLAEEAGDQKAQALAWLGISLGAIRQGSLRGAVESAEKAEAVARSADARSELAQAMLLQGWSWMFLGDLQKALALGERALALNRDLNKHAQMAQSMNLLGMVHLKVGQYAQAGSHLEQALKEFQSLGERGPAAATLNNLGLTAQKRGDFRTALAHYQEALRQVREMKDRDAEIAFLNNVGAARVGLGQYAEAGNDLQEVIRMAETQGFGPLSETYRFLAEAHLGMGKTLDAFRAASKALELGRKVESREYMAAAWRVLGQTSARLGAPVEVAEAADGSLQDYSAVECFAESRRISTETGMKGELAHTLRAWARYELTQGAPEKGKAMWQEAQALFLELGIVLEAEPGVAGESKT